MSWASSSRTEIGRAHVSTHITPRSTVFPYTPLFRSRNEKTVAMIGPCRRNHLTNQLEGFHSHVLGFVQQNRDRKSTRLNSHHTEIYSLPLHAALPIS